MQAKITASLLKNIKPDADGPYEVRDTNLTGFLVRVQPSGVMAYYCQYRRGKRVSLGKVGGVIPADPRKEVDHARKVAMDIIQQEKDGGYNPAKRSVDVGIETLEAFLEQEYVPWFKAHKKPPYSDLNNLNAFKSFYPRKLEDINIRLVDRWSAKRLEAGNKKTTIKRYQNTLKAVLNKAVEWGAIEKNPIAELKPIKTDDLGRVRFLTKKEEKRLLRALDAREKKIRKERDSANAWRRERSREPLPDLNKVAYADHLKPIVLLARDTGMRKGEIINLLWTDVNLDTGLLTVRGEIAKSKKTRHIPLNTRMRELLEAWSKQSKGRHVFPVSSFQTSWKGLIADAGIDDFRFHDLRHDFASRLVMAGVDLKTVQELLGHADLTMTLRYSHLASSHKADAVEKLAG